VLPRKDCKRFSRDKSNRGLSVPQPPEGRRGRWKKQRRKCQTINNDWGDKYNTEYLKRTSECVLKQRNRECVGCARSFLLGREKRQVEVSTHTHMSMCGFSATVFLSPAHIPS